MTRWTTENLKTVQKRLPQRPSAAPERARIDSTKAQATSLSPKTVHGPLRSFSLILPWPPTANHATKHSTTGKHYLTQAHRTYRSEVACSVVGARVLTIRGKYRMSVVCHPPDRRKRDFDNVHKTFSDALQHARAIEDDCYMRQLTVLWNDYSAKEPARLLVDVAELAQ